MNADPTPGFHLLLGARDWLPRLAGSSPPPPGRPDWQPLDWEPRRGAVTLRPDLFRFPARASEARFTPADRRGAARDRFGHAYWIERDRRSIRYRPAGATASATFWSVEHLAAGAARAPERPGGFRPCPAPRPELPALSGLAVTERHFLVAGTLAPAGLLVFDLHGGGAPVWLRWPPGVPFAPFDLAAAPGGGLWVLDRPEGGDEARLWRLDRDLRVVDAGDAWELPVPGPGGFRPLGGTPRSCLPEGRRFPAGFGLGLASPPVPASGDALAVVGLPDGTALVMETDAAAGDTRLHRWVLARDAGGEGGGWTGGSPAEPGAAPLGAPVSLAAALAALLGEATALVGHDMVFLPAAAPARGRVEGTLYVADDGGNQAFAFALATGVPGTAEAGELTLTALQTYLPMRRWAGRALVSGPDRVAGPDCDAGGAAAAFYDLADGWLPLTALPRPRYAAAGWLDGVVLDGREPGCVWHRLFLDGCIPPGDAVAVESRAADTPLELPAAPWQPEPPPRLRSTGRELPWAAAPRGETAAPGEGTWELLFQQARGRWLELRLTLRGSGRSSPKLRALRASYPRPSYLRFLPEAYAEDPVSASFLDRFLANFEGTFSELEARVATAQALFDPRTAPPEALDWLAGWLGATLEDGWDEARRRLFLAHALALYRRRGTRAGLLQAVRLAVDPCPGPELFTDSPEAAGRRPFGVRVVEAFRARSLPPALAGDPTADPSGAGIAPRLVRQGTAWRPELGGALLHRRWREHLMARYADPRRPGDAAAALARLRRAWGAAEPARREAGAAERAAGAAGPRLASWAAVRFGPQPPDGAAGEDWRRFAANELGLPRAAEAATDSAAWSAFLARRYRRVDDLHRAWGLTGERTGQRAGERAGDRVGGGAGGRVAAGFDAVPLPAGELPVDGAALADWHFFLARAYPQQASAHRFTVLVPMGLATSPGERHRRLEAVRAVVERERPAHAAFDVRPYWALFRAGSARVGFDTALGEGSRLAALVLGAGALGRALIAEEHPWNVHDRRVLGRDRIGGPPPLA